MTVNKLIKALQKYKEQNKENGSATVFVHGNYDFEIQPHFIAGQGGKECIVVVNFIGEIK